jgi:hypothetical protein
MRVVRLLFSLAQSSVPATDGLLRRPSDWTRRLMVCSGGVVKAQLGTIVQTAVWFSRCSWVERVGSRR